MSENHRSPRANRYLDHAASSGVITLATEQRRQTVMIV